MDGRGRIAARKNHISVRHRTDTKKALDYALSFGRHDTPDDIIMSDESDASLATITLADVVPRQFRKIELPGLVRYQAPAAPQSGTGTSKVFSVTDTMQ
jgi:hypothetical protein